MHGAYGGDTLVSITSSDGTTTELHAGSGLGFHIGAGFRLNRDIDLRATIGFLRNGQTYKNGSASFIRYPLDISSHYFFDKHGIGGGLAYHLSPKFEADIVGVLEGEAEAENSLGYFVEYLWASKEKGMPWGLYAGLRYTFMSYASKTNPNAEDLNANSLGVNFGLSF